MTKILLLIIILGSVISGFVFKSDEPVISSDEIGFVSGEQWKGKLIYLDYQSKKEVSIPVEMDIINLDCGKYLFIYNYINEPGANSSDTVIISDDGKKFDNETLIEKTILSDSTISFVTEIQGMDDDRASTFRHIYLLSPKKISIKKEVRFNNENTFFKRNEYVFER